MSQRKHISISQGLHGSAPQRTSLPLSPQLTCPLARAPEGAFSQPSNEQEAHPASEPTTNWPSLVRAPGMNSS